MVCVRSETTLILIAGGMEARSCGSSALMRSTVSITFAPGWRWTARMIAGRLSYQAASRLFSGPSTALPMSRMRTGEPLR